jgi:hypothetical protein
MRDRLGKPGVHQYYVAGPKPQGYIDGHRDSALGGIRAIDLRGFEEDFSVQRACVTVPWRR